MNNDYKNTAEEGDIVQPAEDGKIIGQSEKGLTERLGKGGKYARFTMAVLGSIPWIGSFLSAAASLEAEKDQEEVNRLLKLWMEEHKEKIEELELTLSDIYSRLDGFGADIQARMESSQYLTLVRSTFRSWDQAETKEKREMLKKLIINAGGTQLTSDDLVRLFIQWINQYHESHFLVIGEIYKQPGITRGGIWRNIHGETPREDSAEADLFKYLIRELNTGQVIRQERETDAAGNFIRKKSSRSQGSFSSNKNFKSAFDDEEPYELTKLGEQFVHYVLTDLVRQIE